MDSLERYREFLKDNIRRQIDFSRTDQNQGIPAPPIEKPYREDARRINLIQPGQFAEAVENLKQAHQIMLSVLGPQHPLTEHFKKNLEFQSKTAQ